MLRTRIISALVMAAVLLLVLFFAPISLVLVLFSLLAIVAAWEWAGFMQQDKPVRWFYAFLTALFCWQIWLGGDKVQMVFLFGACLFWLFLAPWWLWRRWRMLNNDFVGYALGLLLLMATFVSLWQLYTFSAWILVGILAIACAADISGYFVGKKYGTRKLFADISPSKTWLGAVGGVIGVVVYGSLVFVLTPNIRSRFFEVAYASPVKAIGLVLLTMLLFALLAIFSIVGDLFESMLKRQAGLKDSSGIIPGHGGLLDRVDSQLAILPLTAALSYLL